MEPAGARLEQPPLCTIVIPTRGRARALTECLRSIGALDYPSDRLEVVVVADGDDGVESAVASVRGRLELSVVRTPGVGPAAARNAGVATAGGDILAFIDDDCRTSAGWLRALVAALEGNPQRAVGGSTVNVLLGNPWSTASQRIIDLAYAYYNANRDRASFLTTNNLAVPTAAFREVGGFDASLRTAEDRDFCRRWIVRGLELRHAPDAVVLHANPLTFPAFIRQHFEYGRGAFRFHQRANAEGDTQLRAAAGFYRSLPRLVCTMPTARNTPELVKLAPGLALWQAANAAGFAWEAARSVALSAR